MKKQFYLTILFFFLIGIFFGQTTKTSETTCFLKFDSLLSKLNSDKIVFKKNNDLDTIKSKPYLDSINWFMSRHPTAIIEIKLKKGFNTQYCSTKLGQLQAEQIVRYLINSGTNYRRLAFNGTHCDGQLMVADENLKANPHDKNKLTTIVSIISFDYIDK